MINNIRNKRVLITAGPTREYIDPVRYITNESSGKMGYAIAETLFQLGAEVILISGPVNIETNFPKDKIIHVKTGAEMFNECQKLFFDIDLAVFCAAVTDYTPKEISKIKIKKIETEVSLALQKNVDIAYEFGKVKKEFQKSVGFALETNNVFENAKEKLHKKNFDLIILNSPNINEGFGYDTNKISILDNEMMLQNFELKTKKEVAIDIAKAIQKQYNSILKISNE